MKKIILFDFDGVIVDSFEATFSVAKKFTGKIGIETYKDMFMGNILETVNKKIPKNERKARYDNYYEIYNPLLLKLPVIPGMAETIKQLHANYILIIVSSSVTSPTHAYLESHDLHHFFDEVYGGDVHFSKKKKIDMILKKYKVTAKDCIFITDTVGDLVEAQHHDIDSLVVTWGFHQKHRFKKTPPVDFIEKPEEMVAKVDKYFAKK